jgi:hypothetical protein
MIVPTKVLAEQQVRVAKAKISEHRTNSILPRLKLVVNTI